ncbi:MAG: hypothetical protein U0S48_10585 [Solirubrobacteraceae bacterium]
MRPFRFLLIVGPLLLVAGASLVVASWRDIDGLYVLAVVCIGLVGAAEWALYDDWIMAALAAVLFLALAAMLAISS